MIFCTTTEKRVEPEELVVVLNGTGWNKWMLEDCEAVLHDEGILIKWGYVEKETYLFHKGADGKFGAAELAIAGWLKSGRWCVENEKESKPGRFLGGGLEAMGCLHTWWEDSSGPRYRGPIC